MNFLKRRTFVRVGAATALGLHRMEAFASAPRAVWTFDNLAEIGARPVRIEGNPQLIPSPWGTAVAFNGRGDALFVDDHPLAGAAAFTFEAVFRPDGGAHEQRWFHLESNQQPPAEPGMGDTRLLFEIRVVREEWYLDAFMKGPGYNKALVAEQKRFAVGRWYHVAQTYDGVRYRSYVNGQLQTEVPLAFQPQGAGRASIGARMNRTSYFNGAVREARFTHAPLRPAEFAIP